MKIVEKGWGKEIIWVSNELYCSKKLVFYKKNNKFSMHFHKNKTETWLVESGKFNLLYINTNNGKIKNTKLNKGDIWHNDPLLPHQLIALEDNSIINEVSTKDNTDDNYRVLPGDSQ
jgi:quercetin dioxygenase-like cupin family protein